MNMRHVVSQVCALLLLGCASSDNAGVADVSPLEATDAGSVMMEKPSAPTSPPVVSGGAAECTEDSVCMERAQQELSVLTNAQTNTPVFEGGVCVGRGVTSAAGSVSGPACNCNQGGKAARTIGPAGADCYVYGRLGECLFGDEDFSYCELGETTVCTELCAQLQKRIEAEAARKHAGEIRLATCSEYHCHNVLQVEGHCYADRSYQAGRDYDCALSEAEILEQNEKAKSMVTMPKGELLPQTDSRYDPDANGYVSISVSTYFLGTKADAPSFGAGAQFYSAKGSGEQRADIIDPLEGVDDCGVRRNMRLGVAADVEFMNVDSAALIDGDKDLPLAPSMSSGGNFTSYSVDLKDLGVTPRFGGSYGFRAAGGTFGEEVTVEGLQLPEALTIHELESSAHLDRGPLRVTWTGSNSQPLRLGMSISTLPFGPISYNLDCLMQDDGEFEIPEAVMKAVPNGIARVNFVRESRSLLHDGDKAILGIGSVQSMHDIAYGDRCKDVSVYDACGRYAEKMQQVYRDCSLEAPPLEKLCPDFIGAACTLCPEYYECMAKNAACTNNRVLTPSGCACPP